MSGITKGSPKVVLWRSLLFALLNVSVHTGCSAFRFWKFWASLTLQETRSIHGSMNLSKIEFVSKINLIFSLLAPLICKCALFCLDLKKNARVKVNKTVSYRNRICDDSNTGYPVIATSADSGEMPHVAAFHLRLHCLIIANYIWRYTLM